LIDFISITNMIYVVKKSFWSPITQRRYFQSSQE